jgi:hypothetical protein
LVEGLETNGIKNLHTDIIVVEKL